VHAACRVSQASALPNVLPVEGEKREEDWEQVCSWIYHIDQGILRTYSVVRGACEAVKDVTRVVDVPMCQQWVRMY
jgi:hypothetical protein